MIKLKKVETKTKWFISYLLVLCVPIFMCIVLWFYMQNSINNERIVKGRLQIENIIQSVETEMKINLMAESFFSQNETAKLAVALENLDGEEKRRIVQELSHVLYEYILQTGQEDTIFIYLRRIDTIVTPDGFYDPFKYWKNHYSNSNLSFADWKGILAKTLDVKYNLYSLTFSDKGGGGDYQSFLHTMVARRESIMNFLVVAVQNNEAINYNKNTGGAYFVIYDDKEELVYGSGNIQYDMLPVLLKSKTDEILKIGKQRYIINHEMSSKPGFLFVVAVELYDVFTHSIFPFISIGLIIISSLICIWILWRLSEKNYTVIDRIVMRLRSYRDEITSTNEITMVNYLIDKIVKENQNHQQLLLKQKDHSIAVNISRLLHGNAKAFEGVHKMAGEYGKPTFLGEHFAVVIIVLDDYKRFFEPSGGVAADGVELVRFAVKNVSVEVIGEQGHKAYFADMEEVATLLVSFSPEKVRSAEKSLLENCKFIQTFLSQNLKIQTTIFISDMYIGLENTNAAYKQTLEMLEYKHLLGEGLVITSGDINIQKDVRYSYTQEHESSLINMMKAGDAARAIGLINDVLELEDEQKFQDIKRTQCIIYDIAATLIRFCSTMDIDDEILDENAFLEALSDSKSLKAMKEIIVDASYQISSKYKSSTESSLVTRIADYIEGGYNDSNLSVSHIADNFNFHPTYASNIFKEKMGIGILEYITKVRIDKSVELLVSTNNSVNNISESVGYLNANTYIRNFKKLMGVTPNKFRNIKQ
ncbi:MAG: AraC family transcriptional regulator [Firmicutes bacterium]|nr:AraC family transcriptional regulator [Bacillota bacterium]